MNNLYYRLIKQSQREKLNINKKTLLKIKKLYEEEGKRCGGRRNDSEY